MKFKENPFELYPIGIDELDLLFINREDKIRLAETILESGYETPREISIIMGGRGVGKSSFLNYVKKLAMEKDFSTAFYNDFEDIRSKSDQILKDNDVALIDDMDKLNDEKAIEFYRLSEAILEESGFIFVCDRHQRSQGTVNNRNFTGSQFISLQRELETDKLQFFLEERMKNCMEDVDDFYFPYDDCAIEMASIRSRGNLRNFIHYSRDGWRIAQSEDIKIVEREEMKEAIIAVDSAFLSGLDNTDFRILWYATIGQVNKSYLAHQCNIDRKTLNKHLDDKLSDIIIERRSGMEINLSSIYKTLPDGEEILQRIFRNLGVKRSIVGE